MYIQNKKLGNYFFFKMYAKKNWICRGRRWRRAPPPLPAHRASPRRQGRPPRGELLAAVPSLRRLAAPRPSRPPPPRLPSPRPPRCWPITPPPPSRWSAATPRGGGVEVLSASSEEQGPGGAGAEKLLDPDKENGERGRERECERCCRGRR